MRSLLEIGGDILPSVFLTADSTAHTKDEDGKEPSVDRVKALAMRQNQ
jgi:hypothetical protein